VSESELERRIIAALHVTVPSTARSRQSIMDRVRAVPAHERPRRRAAGGGRTIRHSIVGVALAAGVGSLTTLPALFPESHPGSPSSLTTAVIGDTVSSTLRDTLRLVRLMFDDTSAHRVAAVGDFNAWSAERTPLHRDPATRRWTTTIALRDGAHRYAFVVDGTRWAVDPSTPRARADDGRLYSLLHVASATN
jgi:hypothetical protein